MSAILPAKLKNADVQRFAKRAAQLQKFRPIVTYWCDYYILQQLLQKQLHTADEECIAYSVQLMDKLENFKQANASNDAVVDDVAAKAYVENFALETFSRGDEAQRNNKVTRQTADTFQAAATFLDLLAIWGAVEPDIAAQAKYARFHALRIAKAIKAGEDPNATNPIVEPPAPLLYNNDDTAEAELKELEQRMSGQPNASYRPPAVDSAAESVYSSKPDSTTESKHMMPSTPPIDTPTQTKPVVTSAPRQDEYSVSPIEPPRGESSIRHSSTGGGYFPIVPGTEKGAQTTSSTEQTPSIELPPPSSLPLGPAGFHDIAQKSLVSPPPFEHPVTPAAAVIPPPPTVPNPQVSHGGPPPPSGYRTDDESVMAAQKHAKWAISALNFEDVKTAVKELRIALESLGAG